jgi:hypothetical protein
MSTSAIAENWAFRARSEVESAARFARLSEELGRAGGAAQVVAGLLAAAEDERRHARLCASVAERFGRPDADRHAPPKERIGSSSLPLRDQLLWEMVSAFCIGETMNASLLTTMLELCRDQAIRGVTRELLRDEVRHARLGWTHLAAERAQGRGAFLGQVLPAMLAASVEPDFFAAAEQPWDDELRAFGEPSQSERVSIFETTLRQVIFPGFIELGVETATAVAWLDDKLALIER